MQLRTLPYHLLQLAQKARGSFFIKYVKWSQLPDTAPLPLRRKPSRVMRVVICITALKNQ